MSDKNARWGYGVLGLVVGGSVGLLAGVMMAPASGRDTRRRLARKLAEERRDLARRTRRAVDDLAEYTSQHLENGKEKLGELLHR